MNTQIQHNMQRVVATAAALVVIGVGLKVVVLETLGSFDAASVILALYLASWAFVLGDIGLILSAIWYFRSRKVVHAAQRSAQSQALEPARSGFSPARHTKPCYGC
jgi:uncharacterized membrane protein YidH (DUF202 family)